MVRYNTECFTIAIHSMHTYIHTHIYIYIHDHLINNDIVNNFKSAYKADHSLVRVYTDMVTTNGRGNGASLIYLIYLQLLIQLIMIIIFVFLGNM